MTRLTTGWQSRFAVCAGAVTVAVGVAVAQPPRGERPQGSGVDAALTRLMTLDANGDGKLSKAEVTDERLQPLFQRADTNGDGALTKEELSAQLTKDAASIQQVRPGGPGGPPGGGPGGPGGGPGAPGAGPGGPPLAPVLPPFLEEGLNLTDAQRRDIAELQKDVDSRLSKILTAEQQQQLRQMRNRGPGPGGPGAQPGGQGRPGRPPQRPQ